MPDRDKTAYCGLYCGDCIPGNERLYELASELRELLSETGFAHYAAFKSNKVSAFKDYDAFINVLDSFEKLRCHNGCRKGPSSEAGCTTDCKIRVCAIEKGLDGCWDCGQVTDCERIDKVAGFHPGLWQNLTAIREEGIGRWTDLRGRHYKWSE